MNDVKAKDIMSSPLVTVKGDANAWELSKLMKAKDVGSLLVEQDGHLVGIITKKDLVWRVLAEEQDPLHVKAKDIMSSPLVTMETEVSLSDVARKMAKAKIRRVIVTENQQPVGVVSDRDIVRVAPEQIELLSEYVRILK
ncbi:MAG TPA: CBS domain-containing protein [archaeon]|nr:CBS domain-containing protein [archaeon]